MITIGKKAIWMIRHLSLIFGGIGLLFFGTFGLMFSGWQRFSLTQITGLIISFILILSDLLTVASKKTREKWFSILLLIYSAGILFMGLRPKPGNHNSRHIAPILLETGRFLWYDFIINVIGFIPLSYFLIIVFGKLRQSPKPILRFLLVVSICVAASLCIEILQYFIVGRSSALFDVAGNTLGAVLGGGYGMLYLALTKGD